MAGDDSALSRLGDWDGYQVSSHLTTEIQETTHQKGQGVWIQRICFFSISSQAFFLKLGFFAWTHVSRDVAKTAKYKHTISAGRQRAKFQHQRENKIIAETKSQGSVVVARGGESVNIIQKNLRLKAVVFKVPSHVWNGEKLIYNCQQQQNKIKKSLSLITVENNVKIPQKYQVLRAPFFKT